MYHNRKKVSNAGLELARAVYAPVYVPPQVVADLRWGEERYAAVVRQHPAARLVRPEGQGPVLVYRP